MGILHPFHRSRNSPPEVLWLSSKISKHTSIAYGSSKHQCSDFSCSVLYTPLLGVRATDKQHGLTWGESRAHSSVHHLKEEIMEPLYGHNSIPRFGAKNSSYLCSLRHPQRFSTSAPAFVFFFLHLSSKRSQEDQRLQHSVDQ